MAIFGHPIGLPDLSDEEDNDEEKLEKLVAQNIATQNDISDSEPEYNDSDGEREPKALKQT